MINPCRCIQSPLPSGACVWFKSAPFFSCVWWDVPLWAIVSSWCCTAAPGRGPFLGYCLILLHKFKVDWPTFGILEDCGSICSQSLQYIDFYNPVWPAPFLHKLHDFYINLLHRSHTCSRQLAIRSVGKMLLKIPPLHSCHGSPSGRRLGGGSCK